MKNFYRLIQGDCLQVLPTLEDESIDAIVTDPPFGIGFKYVKKEIADNPDDYWNWLSPIYSELMRVLKKGGLFAVWQAQANFRHFWDWFGDDIHIYPACKNFVQLRKTPINYAYEPIVLKYKSGAEPSYPEKQKRSLDFYVAKIVLKYKSGAKPSYPEKQKRSLDFYVAKTSTPLVTSNAVANLHPCPRPLDQVEIIIQNFTSGNVILDSFMGSGTTMEACQNLKRNCIGIEVEQEYCELTKRRCFGRQFLDREVSYSFEVFG